MEDLSGFEGSRTLKSEEVQRFFPTSQITDLNRGLIHEIAADFDTLRSLAKRTEIDLVLFRVAATDIMTHTFLGDTTQPGGNHTTDLLLSAFRYADFRLGEIYSELDADDVLIVLSDHGAKTALEHDEQAVFFAVGDGILPQELEGAPEIGGLGRLLADLLGVQTDLPSTGFDLKLKPAPI